MKQCKTLEEAQEFLKKSDDDTLKIFQKRKGHRKYKKYPYAVGTFEESLKM